MLVWACVSTPPATFVSFGLWASGTLVDTRLNESVSWAMVAIK